MSCVFYVFCASLCCHTYARQSDCRPVELDLYVRKGFEQSRQSLAGNTSHSRHGIFIPALRQTNTHIHTRTHTHQNMNEIRAGFLKPAIFILALLAAMAPPELRGIWGTGMVMTQRQDSNFTSPTRAALNCWGGSWFYLHETQTNFSLKVQHSQSLLSKSVEVEWDLCTAFM